MMLASSLHMHKWAHRGHELPNTSRDTHMHFAPISNEDYFPEPEFDTTQLEVFTNSISKVLLNKHFSKTFKNKLGIFI